MFVLRKIVTHIRAFIGAKGGNVAMIFGLSLIPLAIAAGMGLDMSRAMITHTRLGNALDAAGLAAGAQPGMDADSMKKLANQYFDQNYTADQNAFGKPAEVTLTRSGQTITLHTSVKMPTTLMNIVGIKTMDVAASSQITWGQTKLWVALVLDNTGSMCETATSGSISSCPTPDPASKIVALQTALTASSTGLLDILKNAATNDGDVKVSIAPFSKDVTYAVAPDGTDTVKADWIDWTDWESEPSTSDGTDPKVPLTSTVGPGSLCPWTDSSNKLKSPYGYYCVSAANGSSKVSKISSTGASIGLICPGEDGGAYNVGDGVTIANRASHYYNGCYDSVATQTSTTNTTQTGTQTCTTSKGKTTCTFAADSSNPVVGTPTITNGYTGDTSTVAFDKNTDKNACSTSGSKTTCKGTQTTTVGKGANFTHTWHSIDHSNWKHCFMDRAQDPGDTYGKTSGDTQTYPDIAGKFPAENSDACPPSPVVGMSSSWKTLSDQVLAMKAQGNTNQTVGLAWGWQTLTNSAPFTPGDLPVDTKRYLILLTDGMNTQNRTTTNQTKIDNRTKALCQNIQDAGIIIYTVYVNLNPPKKKDAGQVILENCATGGATGGKFFALTKTTQIPDTFETIATQITNLRVSL